MLFDEQISRKPNYYPWTEAFCDAMDNGQWSSTEFSFIQDRNSYLTLLNDEERSIIKKTLAMIASIELPVKSYWANLGKHLKRPEFIDLGICFANIERIHSAGYGKLLDVLQLETEFELVLQEKVIANRMKYLKKHGERVYASDKQQFLYSLILFSLYTENVSLFSQFYIVNWFNKFRRFGKDLPNQTAYTAREENLHAEAGMAIFNQARIEYPEFFTPEFEEKIVHEAGEALKAEEQIIDWVIGSYTGEFMSADHLKSYLRNRLNISLEKIGYKKQFEVNLIHVKETRWMDEEIIGGVMTDFFKSRPTEYAKKTQVIDEDSIF
jgi:ribonucleoside-diphosphate reductase beta chain